MNCRTPERNYFYLLSPETCRILELDGEGSGLCSGTLPAPGAEAPEHWVSWEQLALPSPECWDRSPVPEGVADAVGWEGGVKGQGSVSPLLLPCSAAGSVRFCHWVCAFPVSGRFPFQGKPPHTNLFSLSWLKLSFILYPCSLNSPLLLLLSGESL